MLKKLSATILLLAIFALGYFGRSGYDLVTGKPEAASGPLGGMVPGHGGPTSRPQDVAVPVETAPVAVSVIRERVSGSGVLEPDRQVSIVARIEGEVESLAVEEGSRVEQGSVLCIIEEEAVRIAVDVARIERDRAAADLERQKELLERGAASPKEVEDARYGAELAAAAHEDVILRLSYSHPKAPFDGIVIDRTVERGQHVRTGDSLFVIADLEPLRMRLFLPEQEVARVAPGQAVELRPDRNSAAVASGVVERVSPFVDKDSLSVEVTVVFEHVPASVRPGSFGRVDIITRILEEALLVPRRALVRSADGFHVFRILEGDRVQRIPVVTGFQDEVLVEIVEGVEAGELVVVSGQRDLQDGARVKVYREVPVVGSPTPK